MNKTHVGEELTLLRKGKINQADLAKALGMDQSRVSRIEADPKPGADEVKRYLAELNGDPEVEKFRIYYESEWPHLGAKPAYRHPHREELEMAEATLGKLKTFIETSSNPPDLIQQAKQYREALAEVAAFLLDLKHNVAFVGKIAVGKTTALCFVADLLIQEAKTMKQRVALDTGAGWTTQSEVRVGTMDSGLDDKESGKFGIVVYPQPQEEVFKLANDVCHSMIKMRDGKETDNRVPEEVEKVLRSMAELPRTPSKDKEDEMDDPLLDLAETFKKPEELTAEFLSRMKLAERTTTNLWSDAPTSQDGLVWVREEFRKINNGRNTKVPMAKRIDVLVPGPLVPDCKLDLTGVDTKGTEETAIRPDLLAYLDDPRTVTILCSHFAPDANMIELVGHLAATGKGAAITDRLLFLVLPREQEALNMNTEDGSPLGSAKEAYALRKAQIRSKLAKFAGGKDVPIITYDAAKDKPFDLRKAILEKLDGIRSAKSERLKELISAAQDLQTKFQDKLAQIGFAKLRSKLQKFVEESHQLPPQIIKAQARLLAAFNNRHHRTVWATTRRNGEWDNLHSYQIVAEAANEDAATRSKKASADLDTLLDDLSKDPECAAIQSHIVVLQKSVADWKLKFLKKVASRSQEIYRAVLYPDNPLWNKCEGYWGPGFQRNVAGEIQTWLGQKEHDWMHDAIDAIIRAEWQDMFIAPIQEQAKEPAAH